MYEAALEKVGKIASPVLQNLGFRLVDAELTSEHGRFILRLYIEKEGGAVTIDDCEFASRAVEDVIEAEAVLGMGYDLEVSSPGLDRPLKTKGDFERFRGREIALKTKESIEGRSNYKGLLEDIKDDKIFMVVDEVKFEIPFDLVLKARLVPDFEKSKKSN